MIRAAMLWIAQTSFNPRGKHLALRTWDRLLGATSATTASGVKLRIRLGSSQDLSFLRDKTDPLVAEIRKLPPGGVFIDVGANIGYYTILASRAVGATGTCIACEPSQREYVRLLHHVRANNAGGVVAINAAIGETTSTARLRVAEHHTGLNDVVYREKSDSSAASEQTCLVLALDEIVPALAIGCPVDLLKVDVEGAELAVLRGARRLLMAGRVKTIFVEVTDAYLARHRHSASQLYQFMDSCGYRPLVGPLTCFQYDEVFVRDSNAVRLDAEAAGRNDQ